MRVRVLMGVGGLEPALEEFAVVELPASLTLKLEVGRNVIPILLRLEEVDQAVPPPPPLEGPPSPAPPGSPPVIRGGGGKPWGIVNRAA
jgi:hypothetical protein